MTTDQVVGLFGAVNGRRRHVHRVVDGVYDGLVGARRIQGQLSGRPRVGDHTAQITQLMGRWPTHSQVSIQTRASKYRPYWTSTDHSEPVQLIGRQGNST